MQAWIVPPLNPPGTIRLQDNLERKGLVPRRPHRDGVPSATVEVHGFVDETDERFQTFKADFNKDLVLAFRNPPPTLQGMELRAFMSGDSTDPAKTIKSIVLGVRGWYQAPLQIEARERARVEALYK